MYGILIVDDEKIIRMGMEKAVDWSSAGVDRVFTAGCAEDALDILEKEKIHILITDIQMGGMSGLDLIERVRIRYPSMRIIVLTGFDEFDYAHRCLKMKVEDFLLKPVDEDYMAELVGKQIQELEAEKKSEKMAGVMRRVVGSIEQEHLNRLMRRLLKGQSPASEAAAMLCEKYQYSPGQKMQAAVLVPRVTEENQEEKQYHFLMLRDFCNQNIDLRERGITFCDEDGRIVIAWFLNDRCDDAAPQVEELIQLLKNELGITQKIVLGSAAEGFVSFWISYNDAVILMEKEWKSYQNVIQDRQKVNQNQIFWEVFAEIKNAIALNQGNEDMILRAYAAFCQMTEVYGLSVEYVRRCCFELASLVYFDYVANHRGVKGEDLYSYTEAVLSARTEDALAITRAFIENMYDSEEEKSHDLIAQSQNYIRDHLSEELSVTGIAQMMFLTPSYFSRLFKKVTHEGCNDYIVRLRMEKARYLLESTNLKTGDIAQMVGYHDKNYFSLAFKKYIGMSPTAYRENCRPV
ncbi:MAG: response regulator transcription factor [Ruminococcus sp.]|jgi:two-component system response regulator YesN